MTVEGKVVNTPNPEVNIPQKLIRSDETGDKVFLVESGNIIHWIMNPEALQAVNGDFGDVETVKRVVFKDLVLGERITVENAANYRLPEKKASEESPLVATPAGGDKEEFKTYEEPEFQLQLKEDLISIVAVLVGDNVDGLKIVSEQVKEFKKLLGTANYELIIVVNGSTIKSDDARLSFAQKIIVNEEPLSKTEAVNQGVRIAEGSWKLIMY